MHFLAGLTERLAFRRVHRSSWAWSLGSLAGLLCASAAQAAVIYPVSLTITSSNPTGNASQSDTVSGTITTDGTIGILSTGNILGYDLKLIDNLSSASNYELTPSNSMIVENLGGDLTASASSLSFNFGSSGEFLIQASTPGSFSGYRYFCLSTGGACLPGETISPGYIVADGAVLTGAALLVGMQPLGPPITPPSTPVPEPTTIALLGLGAAGIGLTRTRVRR